MVWRIKQLLFRIIERNLYHSFLVKPEPFLTHDICKALDQKVSLLTAITLYLLLLLTEMKYLVSLRMTGKSNSFVMEKLEGNTPRDICSISCKEGPLAVAYNCFTNEIFNPSDFVDRFTLTKGRSVFVESICITPQAAPYQILRREVSSNLKRMPCTSS